MLCFILALGKWETPNVVTERTGAGTRKEVDVTEKVTTGLGSSQRPRLWAEPPAAWVQITDPATPAGMENSLSSQKVLLSQMEMKNA